MIANDTSNPVMVTGANGFVASWLVKKLLDEGFTVHAAVRDPENGQKHAHLRELSDQSKGTIRFFKADLLNHGSYAEAMQDCSVVFHTASPFILNVKDPKKELIEPALKGTENVLLQANKTSSVKRVVLTSSCAAIYTDAIDTQNAPGGKITEEVWNTTASLAYQPYSYSKTLAEKKAWEIANTQNQWELVTINPSLVMGPALNQGAITSESYNLLKLIGDGTLKLGAPNMGLGVVDVRDVAQAHFNAGFHENAKGRYITSAHSTNMIEMAAQLQEKYGEKYPIPSKAIPKWVLMIMGPLLNKTMNRKMVRNNIDVSWNADNSKIKNDFGMTFLPLKQTMEDSFQTLIDKNIISSK